MEQLRIQEKNKTRNDIRMVEKHIETANNTIKHRKETLRADDEFNMNEIAKLEQRNVERKEQLEQLKKRMTDISEGRMDKEFEQLYTANQKEINDKAEIKRLKKQQILEDKQERKQKLSKFYEREKARNRSDKATAYEMKRAYKHYLKVCDSIPDYIQKKLDKLPNNKGYIWRGVHCYGSKPSEPGRPVSLFERQRGNIQLTHEWTSTHCKGLGTSTKWRTTKIDRKPST